LLPLVATRLSVTFRYLSR